jgi:hypothetical protein
MDSSLLSTFVDAGLAVLRRSEQAQDNARRLIARARLAHDTAARVIERTRELMLTRRPHRFRPIAGGSDGRPGGLHEAVWISTAVSYGARCADCGRAIAVGDPMYDVVADGREIRLDADCGRLHMEQWRSRVQRAS